MLPVQSQMSKEQFQQLLLLLEHAHDRIAAKFPNELETELVVAKPASEDQINAMSKRIGRDIPLALQSLYRHSSQVEFRWCLGSEYAPPKIEGDSCDWGGGLLWSLDALPELVSSHVLWRDVKRTAGWQDKFPVFACANGDMLAVESGTGRVTYLSHDASENPEQDMSEPYMAFDMSYPDFLLEWARVGCPGPEYFPLHFFLKGGWYEEDGSWCFPVPSVLDGDGDQARKWRRQLGLLH